MAADATDLGYVRLRLARAFVRRPVLAYHGIQYRLAEVGPYRFEARQLDKALLSFSTTSGRLTRSHYSLYADPTIEKQAARTLVAVATDTLSDIANCNYVSTIDRAAASIKTVLRTQASIETGPNAPSTPIGQKFAVPRPSVIIHSESRRGPAVICWLTHELPLLYPDDPRLWNILALAERTGAFALVIARKVAPVTFPLLKAIGAYALQYHLPLFPRGAPTKLGKLADEIGWPPFQDGPGLHGHPVLTHIRKFNARIREPGSGGIMPRGAREAVQEATARGFPESPKVSAQSLLSWAETSVAPLPPRWIRNIESWASNDYPYEIGPSGHHSLPDAAEDLTEDDNDLFQESRPRSPTVVSRGLVAAEVDRETWNRAVAKIAKNKEKSPEQIE